jgi:putative transposase
MTQYRRNWTAGGTYFFTVVTANRTNGPLVDHIADLRGAFRTVIAKHPFEIDAMVILPDHLHTLWTLPPGDADYATRWKKIKGAFSKRLPDNEPRSASQMAKGERGIWQRRYWEHTIRDDDDFRAHCDYIHFNPVKHGYVRAVSEWPHSTFRQFVERGVYPMDWGGAGDDKREFGE